MKEITIMNWDDIVRAEKRKSLKEGEPYITSITWGDHGWNILRKFTKKETYFGIKHYHDPQVTGFTVQR